jgi:hypothetical protein
LISKGGEKQAIKRIKPTDCVCNLRIFVETLRILTNRWEHE